MEKLKGFLTYARFLPSIRFGCKPNLPGLGKQRLPMEAAF